MSVLFDDLVRASQKRTRWIDGLETCYAWNCRSFCHHSRFHDSKDTTGGFTMANVCFDLCEAIMLPFDLLATKENDLLHQRARVCLDFSYHS